MKNPWQNPQPNPQPNSHGRVGEIFTDFFCKVRCVRFWPNGGYAHALHAGTFLRPWSGFSRFPQASLMSLPKRLVVTRKGGDLPHSLVPTLCRADLGWIFYFGPAKCRKIAGEFLSEFWWRISRANFSALFFQGFRLPKKFTPKIHVQKCRHSSPISLSWTQIYGDFLLTGEIYPILLGQKSCRTKVARIFWIFVPNFAPNFAPNFPRIFRGLFVLRFVGDGDQKKFTKNPRHFSMQNSQANTKKIFIKFFWRAGRVTFWGGQRHVSLGRPRVVRLCARSLPIKPTMHGWVPRRHTLFTPTDQA